MCKSHITYDMFSWVHVVFQMADSIPNAVSESVFTIRVNANWSARILPLPLRPTNLRSLKRATWFFMTAVAFRSSAEKFSSLPAAIETRTPSGISPSATTLNATGSVLLHLQCDGNTLQTKFGESVFTSSPGYSASASMSDRSPLIFRGTAFSVAVVMVLQCVNHKSEPPEYVWRVWHTTGRLNQLKCFWPTTPLRFDICWAYLFCVFVMYNRWANSGGRLNSLTRPPLAFIQWAHVLRIPMNSVLISRAFLWFNVFARIIVWWHWRTELRRTFAN